jgi:hypothetical protein
MRYLINIQQIGIYLFIIFGLISLTLLFTGTYTNTQYHTSYIITNKHIEENILQKHYYFDFNESQWEVHVSKHEVTKEEYYTYNINETYSWKENKIKFAMLPN